MEDIIIAQYARTLESTFLISDPTSKTDNF